MTAADDVVPGKLALTALVVNRVGAADVMNSLVLSTDTGRHYVKSSSVGNLTFTAASPNTILRSVGTWTADGFQVGDVVTCLQANTTGANGLKRFTINAIVSGGAVLEVAEAPTTTAALAGYTVWANVGVFFRKTQANLSAATPTILAYGYPAPFRNLRILIMNTDCTVVLAPVDFT